VGLLTASLTTTPVGAVVKEDKELHRRLRPEKKNGRDSKALWDWLIKDSGSSGTIGKDEVVGVERKEDGEGNANVAVGGSSSSSSYSSIDKDEVAGVERKEDGAGNANVAVVGSSSSIEKDEVVGVERRLDGFGNANVFVGTNSSTCMQDASGRKQTCTANDIRLAAAENITIDAGGCKGNPTDTVTFSADFLIELTAQERYDIGVWFATDGDVSLNGNPPDGALKGQCTVATPPFAPDPPYVNLDVDQPTDICGDIDAIIARCPFGSSLPSFVLLCE
jgi:hypothetical protein